MPIASGNGYSAVLGLNAPFAAGGLGLASPPVAGTATWSAITREMSERVTDNLMSYSSELLMAETEPHFQLLSRILENQGDVKGQLATLLTLIAGIQRDQTALASRLEGVELRLGKLENFRAAHIAADEEKRKFMERIETEGNAQRQSIARGLNTMQKSELKAKTALGVIFGVAAILWSLIQMNGAAIRSAFKALLRGE